MLHQKLAAQLIHDYPAICRAGGTEPMTLYHDRLVGALAAAEQRVSMFDLSSDAVSMAGYALWLIARDHPATDGNKRLALAAAQLILGAEGFVLDEAQKAAVIALVLAAAKKDVDIEAAATKLAEIVL